MGSHASCQATTCWHKLKLQVNLAEQLRGQGLIIFLHASLSSTKQPLSGQQCLAIRPAFCSCYSGHFSDDYRGIVTISPTPTFLVLTNNTKARRAREANETVPAMLDWMTYHDFAALSQRNLPHVYYKDEYYYFQGRPHEELGMTKAFDSLPASCWKAQPGAFTFHAVFDLCTHCSVALFNVPSAASH